MAHPYDELFRPDEVLERRINLTPTPVHEQKPVAALEVQVGGNHYKSQKIQPIEFIAANGLDFFQGNVIKYVTRRKGDTEKRLEDLNKAKHYIDLYMDFIKKGELA